MPDKPKKLKKQELNRRFIEGLGDHVLWSSDEDSAPLLIDICSNTGAEYRLRAYLFNLTNPPGGRAADEYKAQIILPGQQKKERASLDYSDGRFPLLVAYAQEGKDGVFVLWDADTAAKFALAYALKNHFDEFDPGSYAVSDSGGNNYNIGTVDKDGQLSQLLRAIYPGIETPYIYARALMVYGLLKIGELIETGGMPNISNLCD